MDDDRKLHELVQNNVRELLRGLYVYAYSEKQLSALKKAIPTDAKLEVTNMYDYYRIKLIGGVK